VYVGNEGKRGRGEERERGRKGEGERVQFGVEGWNVAKKRGRGGEREKRREGEIFTLFLQGFKYII